MRQLASIAFALVIVTCGGGAVPAASSPTPADTLAASPSASAAATTFAVYAPTAEGFASKVLIEKPRTLSTSANGYVWIVPGASSDGNESAL